MAEQSAAYHHGQGANLARKQSLPQDDDDVVLKAPLYTQNGCQSGEEGHGGLWRHVRDIFESVFDLHGQGRVSIKYNTLVLSMYNVRRAEWIWKVSQVGFGSSPLILMHLIM